MTEPASVAGQPIPQWAEKVRKRSRTGVGPIRALVGQAYRLTIRLSVIALLIAVPWSWCLAHGVTARAVRAVTVVAAFFVLPVMCLTWMNPPASFAMLRGRTGRRRASLRQHWVRLDQIAVAMPIAVVASEDPYFLWHLGFDPVAILTARRYNRHGRPPGGKLRGGSTLTQQLAKNLFLPSTKSYLRKLLEAVFTMLMEGLWSKRRILEMYLNVVEFGDDVFGVEAAAQRFFGCPAAALTSEHAALLAAALPRPRTYRVEAPSPAMREQQAAVLRRMAWCGTELFDQLSTLRWRRRSRPLRHRGHRG